MKQVLMVGAGAVAQVYAGAMERAGLSVTFYVRPRYRAQVSAGMELRRLRRFGAPVVHRFAQPKVVSSVEEVAAQRWDAVWFCIPSSGVHEEGTRALLEAIRGSLLVSLSPGLDDHALLASVHPEADIVTGMIPFAAWSEGEPVAPGALPPTVYYEPPLTRYAFAGARVDEVLPALRAGGLCVRKNERIAEFSAFGSTFLIPLVAELETAGWSFSALDATHRRRFREVMKESGRAVAAETGGSAPFGFSLLPWLIGPLTLKLGNLGAPFDLEGFLRQHFTKVGAQTDRMLDGYAEVAAQRGLGPTPALDSLREARREKRLDR